jgi:hypothetical protein
MNYEAAIAFARQRMREIGKSPCEYHMDVLSVVGTLDERTAGEITIQARNEYLYLLNYEELFGLLIMSDYAYFHADDYSFNTKSQEFTGLIKIIRLPSVAWSIDNPTAEGGGPHQKPVDFLRVVIH